MAFLPLSPQKKKEIVCVLKSTATTHLPRQRFFFFFPPSGRFELFYTKRELWRGIICARK